MSAGVVSSKDNPTFYQKSKDKDPILSIKRGARGD
jgi:hypothetical protein